MDILLWRHAEAEDGADDMARALTRKGREQARVMAAWLREHAPHNLATLTSPAVRTRQTAAAFTEHFQVLDALRPGAESDRVLQALIEVHDQCRGSSASIYLVVGHQPTLGRVAARLMTGLDYDWSIKKGAVWWIETSAPDANGGTLKLVVTPKLIAHIG